MRQFKLLVLTDHNTHSEENSIYSLLREMLKHSRCKGIDVASRGNSDNLLFFEKMMVKTLTVSPVDLNFFFYPDGKCFKKGQKRVSLLDYDAVLLRLPHPIAGGFWEFLMANFPNSFFINAPVGIVATGSKAFLLNYPKFSPPLRLCLSVDDIIDFKNNFPIVLKPLKSYAGQGIVKIAGDRVSLAEGGEKSFPAFIKSLEGKPIEYLGAKFLQNVSQGDKRIVVCCGKILGAALRLPKPGNWVCNVARGGSSTGAEADEDEQAIIRRLSTDLEKLGVVFFGVDTLAGDDGRRLLSEINTLSIGGLPKIAEYSGRPVVRQAADLLWDHIQANVSF